jgi:hypothetical protein
MVFNILRAQFTAISAVLPMVPMVSLIYNNYGYLGSSLYGVYGRTDNGTNTGYGGYFYNTTSSSTSYGVYANANFSGTSNPSYNYAGYFYSYSTDRDSYGAYISNTNNGAYFARGLQIYNYNYGSTSTSYDYGLYLYTYKSSSTSGSTNYGLYSSVSGGATRWAGYFTGGQIYAGGGCSGCDLAELFPSSASYRLPSAMFVSLDDNGTVSLSEKPFDRHAVGIISRTYSILIGNTSVENEIRPQMDAIHLRINELDRDDREKHIDEIKMLEARLDSLTGAGDPAHPSFAAFDVPVALIGRVQLNVTSESGLIKKGDFITTSKKAGYGMRVNRAGVYFAVALEDQLQDEDQILVKVTEGYYTPENSSDNTIADFGVAPMLCQETFVTFSDDFISRLPSEALPVVTVTPQMPGVVLSVTGVTPEGFRVVGGNGEKFTFSWIAIAKR